MLRSLIIRSTFAIALFSAIYLFAANQVFTGIVTDDMCASKHTMMPGKPDSECVHVCVKAGSRRAIFVWPKVYKVNGKNDQVDKLAGQKVKIVGDLAGDNLRVVTIESTR
jgi:hypothetical protein